MGSQIAPELFGMGLFQKPSTLDLRIRRDRFAFRPLNPPISPVATSRNRLSSARLLIGGCREALRTLESGVRGLQASAAW